MTIENRKNNVSGFDIIAINSGIGIIGWIITDFFGGMIIWMLSYDLIILPILLLYIISLIRNGKRVSKTKLIN